MVFLDWEEGALIRRIDVAPRSVYWNETGELVLLACDESYFGARLFFLSNHMCQSVRQAGWLEWMDFTTSQEQHRSFSLSLSLTISQKPIYSPPPPLHPLSQNLSAALQQGGGGGLARLGPGTKRREAKRACMHVLDKTDRRGKKPRQTEKLTIDCLRTDPSLPFPHKKLPKTPKPGGRGGRGGGVRAAARAAGPRADGAVGRGLLHLHQQRAAPQLLRRGAGACVGGREGREGREGKEGRGGSWWFLGPDFVPHHSPHQPPSPNRS